MITMSDDNECHEWSSYQDFCDDMNKLTEFGGSKDLEIVLDIGNLLIDSEEEEDDTKETLPDVLPTRRPDLLNANDLDEMHEEIRRFAPAGAYSDDDVVKYFKQTTDIQNGENSEKSSKEDVNPRNSQKGKKSPIDPKLEFRPLIKTHCGLNGKEEWKPMEKPREFSVTKEDFPTL